MNDSRNNDTHSYKGWLNSNSFVKRALAVWGYQLVGNFIIGLIFLIVVILPLLVLGISFR